MNQVGESRPDPDDGALWTVAEVLPGGELFIVPALPQKQALAHALLAPRRVIAAAEFSRWGLFGRRSGLD